MPEALPAASSPAPAARRVLFAASFLILFLELACIRWFPAHVLFLTFFTNTVLLASFLGMSLGCLAAGWQRRFLAATPALLGFALVAAHGVELLQNVGLAVAVENQASPQQVYFGADYANVDIAKFVIPVEVLGGFFFVLIALIFVGPGQELGRALAQVPGRVQAYTIDILGSMAGIALFALCSWLELSPLWWFLPVAALLAWFLRDRPGLVGRLSILALIIVVASLRTFLPYLDPQGPLTRWSPYYRIDFGEAQLSITVNQIGHQMMIPREKPYPAYALPHLLNRDAGRPRYKNVLIIGAGSGNDVARALEWGAEHVDAVEIDPAIQRLGAAHHPNKPYADPRVTVHLDDGRNFLKATDQQYDLIIYALVDSLVLQSSYSNIRLESYLFTKQAFEDVKARLRPGGQFIMYNLFRQGWIVARLQQGLAEVFGAPPLVLTLPKLDAIAEDTPFLTGFALFIAGDTTKLKEAFAAKPTYWWRVGASLAPDSPNGFQAQADDPKAWQPFGLATVTAPPELKSATDDWPFLYLRRPMVPDLSLRGVAIMGGLALALWLWFVAKRGDGQPFRFDVRMFFLGAGFMLIETKAVVHMALLFGSTWMVNTIVFFAVLAMILLANLFVLRVRPTKLWPYFIGLFAALGANAALPLDVFLGLDRPVQIVASCALVFAPVAFAGVIFAVCFSRTKRADQAFAANIAGAMFGGLAENLSMALGFQLLGLVAIAFYAAATAFGRREE